MEHCKARVAYCTVLECAELLSERDFVDPRGNLRGLPRERREVEETYYHRLGHRNRPEGQRMEDHTHALLTQVSEDRRDRRPQLHNQDHGRIRSHENQTQLLRVGVLNVGYLQEAIQ